MSAPRLVVCGLEPGPAVALAAGALLAAFADERAVRPVLLGADLPLWRLLYGASSRAPRVLDPRLIDDAVAGELYDAWSADADLTAHRRRRARAGPLGGRQRLARRWTSRPRSTPRSCSSSTPATGAPRPRPPPAARACWPASVEFAGVIVVGGDDQGPAGELRRILEETARLPVLGWLPPQLSEQFARQYGGGQSCAAPDRPAAGQGRRGGALPGGGRLPAIATAWRRRPRAAASCRRAPRRLLAPLPAAAGLTLAVAWGPPLEPFALEAIDLFKAMGLTLEPLHIGRDKTLPEGAAGLFLAGLLDEEELPAFAANDALQDEPRGGHRRRPADAGGGRRRPAAAPPPRRQPRTHARAGRRPAGRGRTPRVVRASPVRARAGRRARTRTRTGETTLYELFDLEFLTLQQEAFAWRVGEAGEEGQVEGFVHERCLATTLVPSLAAAPGLAASFVAAMRLAAPGE